MNFYIIYFFWLNTIYFYIIGSWTHSFWNIFIGISILSKFSLWSRYQIFTNIVSILLNIFHYIIAAWSYILIFILFFLLKSLDFWWKDGRTLIFRYFFKLFYNWGSIFFIFFLLTILGRTLLLLVFILLNN